MKEKQPIESSQPQTRDELFGLDKQESLQSAKFATTENSYLNENYVDEVEE
ncbi:hypothetical protein [Bacillus salacetis]|uniref:hypothetical protein n=1 Tax=Bacillus salacetis TaxID=2315464 RepID=UPI0014446910|nr:hypothetical protein [Bacillus salacetis]